MNLFQFEAKRNWKGFVIWSIVLSALILLELSVYPSMKDQVGAMEDMMKSLPEAMVSAFNLDTLDLANLMDFYSMEAYLFITLLGSIYAILFGVRMLAKEEENKTVEFLLSMPISREQVFFQKASVVGIYVTSFNLILLGIALAGFTVFADGATFKISDLLLLHMMAWLLHLTFASLGYLISIKFNKAKMYYSPTIGLVLLMYFLSIIAKASDKTEWLEHISLFSYVDAASVIHGSGIESKTLLVLLGVIIVSLSASFMVYRKKDISS